MKITPHILSWFLLATSVATCFAQDKPIVSTAPPPPAANYPVTKEAGKAKVSYNAKKDESIADTKNSLVYGKSLDGILISAQFLSKGKNAVKPKSINLKIYPAAKDRTYVDDRTIKIIVGKKQVISGTSNFIRANSNGQITLAALEQEIPYKTFVKISKAKNVKMQIGPAIFELKDSDLEAFRDLLKTIED